MVINVPSNENFDNTFSIPDFEEDYNNCIDAAFQAFGRTITLHLQPQVTEASGLNTLAPAPTRYAPIFGRSRRPAPTNFTTVRTPGVKHEPRDVQYTAMIKHGPAEIDDKGYIGRLEVDQVMTTLVFEALAQVNEAESATIDGKRYKLLKGPRPIGLQIPRYLIVIWDRTPEKER